MKPLFIAFLAAMILAAAPVKAQFGNVPIPKPGQTLPGETPSAKALLKAGFVQEDGLIVYTVADPKAAIKIEERVKGGGDVQEGEAVNLAKGEGLKVIGQSKDPAGWIQVEINRQETSMGADGNVVVDSDGKPVWNVTKGWVRASSSDPQTPEGVGQLIPADSKIAPMRTDSASLSKCRADFLKSLQTFVNPSTPYVWGGTSHRGVDCSGLEVAALNEIGCSARLPRTAADMQRAAKPVDCANVQEGDQIFVGSPAHHVFTFCGKHCGTETDKQVVEARQKGTNVTNYQWQPSGNGQTCGSLLP